MTVFLRRIWALVRPNKTRLFLGLLCSIGFAITNPLLMVAVKVVPSIIFARPGEDVTAELVAHIEKLPRFLRALIPTQALHLQMPFSTTGLVLAICSIPLIMLLRSVFSYLNTYLMTWVASRAVAELRLKLFDHIENLSLGFFDSAKTGNLISRILSDTGAVHITIATSFVSLVRDPLTVIIILVPLLALQPRLTLVSLLVLPACAIPVVVYGRKVRKSTKAVQTHIADLTEVMHEAFTGNRVVKAYNLEKTVLERFKAALRSHLGQYMRIVRAQELPGPMIEFFGGVGVAMVLAYVAFLSDPANKPKIEDLLQFLLAIVLLYPAIKAIGRLQNQLHQARAASERVFTYLDTKSTIVDPPNPVPLHAGNADIHFEDIDFDYVDKPVLRGINLTVKAGKMVAVVGSSGSGKTTLTNLLLRFYDPQRGSVRIGGTDIRAVTTRELRSQIALVAQDTLLFNDSVRNNIALGRPGASPAEIETAARHAYAHEFIMEKEHGYDTIVGEKGASLSGGQRQRLAIARAILKNAPILVLDEAMSALDTESERAVQNALEELMIGRTTICIAHRLSTVQKADLIVVMDQGRIVETGMHADLIQRRGIYCKLYELQFAGAALASA
jgi:subfamily B ATP-binding cassette protein MsbA